MNSVKVIAEAGVNHNGSLEIAYALVDAAVIAGADIVKFQSFKAKNLVTKGAQLAQYQVQNMDATETQLTMLQRLELNQEAHLKLLKYCNNKGIEFLSTAFDSESLAFLVDIIKLKTLKIPSGEITNAPFILEHARTGCDLILSTGMATLSEIEMALSVIAFGYMNNTEENPDLNSFERAYASIKGQNLLKKKVTLLHCTTEYPAPVQEINLRSMDTIRNSFDLPTGYSDHSEGIYIPIVAVALGAVIIEKHFTLDRSMEGPDHKASLEPNELRTLVQEIKKIEVALGSPIKAPTESEIKNKISIRKSIVAKTFIKAGQTMSSLNLTVKRPGHGVSPSRYWELIGTAAGRDYKEGETIDI